VPEQSTMRPSFPAVNRWYGALALAVFTAFIAAGLVTELPERPLAAVVGTVVAVTTGARLLLIPPRIPLVWAVLSAGGVVVLVNGSPSNVGWFGVCVLGGWCALLGGKRSGGAFLAASLVVFAAEWGFAVHDPGWGPWAGGTILTVLAALVVRHQLVLVDQLRVLQADLAQRSRAEERTRIAREIHDVIAHSLTVSLLHVSSARLAVEHDPTDAARALADAERLTRQSLADVRATVGMLRQPGDDGRSAPAPGIGGLTGLVENLRGAQADVTLHVDGDLDAIPATTGTTVYRIVQESLTNAARHAPGSAVKVRVAADRNRVDVSVDSDGAPGVGTGMGLTNMKERAEAVGGTCSAGPSGAGWRVHATLPAAGAASGQAGR
jgi:signal transduction histidine kinase